jgi:hypothetical protein
MNEGGPGAKANPTRPMIALRTRPSIGPSANLAQAGAADLSRGNRGGAGAFAFGRLTRLNSVLNRLSFGQIVKSLIGHGRVMKEDILSGISLNESKSLVVNQFLDLT